MTRFQGRQELNWKTYKAYSLETTRFSCLVQAIPYNKVLVGAIFCRAPIILSVGYLFVTAAFATLVIRQLRTHPYPIKDPGLGGMGS